MTDDYRHDLEGLDRDDLRLLYTLGEALGDMPCDEETRRALAEFEARRRADSLCAAYNALPPGDAAGQRDLLRTLIPDLGEGVTILAPLWVDYGVNCRIISARIIRIRLYIL